MSYAQANRVMFGEVNNQNSKYKYLDNNDLLDYKFKDAVIGNETDKEQGDKQSDVSNNKTAPTDIDGYINYNSKH